MTHYLLSIKKLKCAFASIEFQKMVQFICLRPIFRHWVGLFKAVLR